MYPTLLIVLVAVAAVIADSAAPELAVAQLKVATPALGAVEDKTCPAVGAVVGRS